LKPNQDFEREQKKNNQEQQRGKYKSERSAAELFIRRALIPYYKVDFKPNSTPSNRLMRLRFAPTYIQ